MIHNRKGNLMLVILYGTVLAFVLVGMMSLAAAYRKSLRDSGEDYADFQTFRAVTEIACYACIRDLQSQEVTIDAGAEWLSVSDNIMCLEALDAIQKAVFGDSYGTWGQTDAKQIISSVGVTDPDVILDMQALLSKGSYDLKIKSLGPMDLNWEDSETYISRTAGHIAVAPFSVLVEFDARNERLREEFVVSGLYLDMSKADDMYTFIFGTSQEGGDIKIERPLLEGS